MPTATLTVKEQIERALEELWPAKASITPIHEACRYALLSGGKRLRPAVALHIAEALGKGYKISEAALAVEYFHTASLVVDDLPCMDDDETRRDQPTVHKVYGEAVTLLVSYALIADGYGLLAKNRPPCSPEACALVLENAAHNTGLRGATGGQFLDLFPPALDLTTQKAIIHKKTSSLFEIAFLVGWLYGGGDPARIEEVKQCAAHFGLAFQIADDLDDLAQDTANGRLINIAAAIGAEEAEKLLDSEKALYKQHLAELGIATIDLEALL